MNNYEDWAQLVARNLKGEGDLIAAIEKDELDDAAATQAFVRAVLEPFLPENFGIGAGRVVDAFGNYSDHLDIIVYDRDFPRIGFRGTQAAYLYESVFAAFAIRAKFVRKTFFDALTSCASLAELNANVDKLTLAKLARKNGLTRDSKNRFVHRDPLQTARFNLIGRPPAFVFGFVGMKQSYRQLQQNIELWIEQRRKAGAEAEMKSLPAVIATQGCFAWRNAAPLALSNREMLGIGSDSAPVRLIILQLLYLLNRRLNVTSDSYGLKPNLKSYLNQFSPPRFELGVANVADVVSLKPATGAEQKAMEDAAGPRYEPAMDRARTDKSAAPATPPEPAPKAAPAPEPAPEVQFESKFEPTTKTKPDSEEPAPAGDTPAPFAAPKTAPLGSAPIPVADADDSLPVPEMPADPETKPESTAAAPAAEPRPAPKTAPETDAAAPAKPVTDVIPPKPPVDIDLGFASDATDAEAAEESASADKENEPEDDFAQTVVIPPSDGERADDGTRNSTDAFIARVKEQLASTEPVQDPDKDKDSFTSTVPQ